MAEDREEDIQTRWRKTGKWIFRLDGGRQGSGYLVRYRTQSTSRDDSSSQSDIAEVGRRNELVYEVPLNELLNNTDTSNE